MIAVVVSDIDDQRLVHLNTSRIDIMRPDGAERRTAVPADGRVTGPITFSPDGSRILFSKGHARETRRPVNFDMYESDLASGRVAVVVAGRFYELFPIFPTSCHRVRLMNLSRNLRRAADSGDLCT